MRSGLAFAVVALAMLSSTSGALSQVSPGPLAEPHRDLDSTLKCLKCHEGGAGSMGDRCQDCHQAIRWLIERHRGLHGREAGAKCASCHPEHAGRDFALIQWGPGGPDRFDHARAGWPLRGKHAEIRCKDCHKPELQRSPALAKEEGKPTWVGLEQSCGTCHDDAHRGALGQNCLDCHDERAWKPAPRFDHARTGYPLTGKHVQVACAKCHLAASLAPSIDVRGTTIPVYKPVPHAECSTCHSDPHKGQLGAACGKCHNTGTFHEVAREVFDHDKTRYPLRGKHVALTCASCHDPKTAWGKKPAFAACGSCHQDAHAGQATLSGKATDCDACHDVTGFSASTYTVARHASSAYPLAGRHQEVRCAACHVKNPKGVTAKALGKAGVRIRVPHARCQDCHEELHGGQLARRPDRGACEACHRVEGWKPSTFTVKEHAALRLPLEGRHADAPCSACHGPERKGLPSLPGPGVLGKAKVALALENPACVACHLDPHDGRFSAGGAHRVRQECLACHDCRAFRPSKVDVAVHGELGWPLEGGHRAAPCIACHDELKAKRAASSLLRAGASPAPLHFSAKRERCESCHETPHGDQFGKRSDGGACGACHGIEAFRPASRFDHDRDAAFKLAGAHAKVACDRCHASRQTGAGRRQVVYRPVSTSCESCHAKTPASSLRGRS